MTRSIIWQYADTKWNSSATTLDLILVAQVSMYSGLHWVDQDEYTIYIEYTKQHLDLDPKITFSVSFGKIQNRILCSLTEFSEEPTNQFTFLLSEAEKLSPILVALKRQGMVDDECIQFIETQINEITCESIFRSDRMIVNR